MEVSGQEKGLEGSVQVLRVEEGSRQELDGPKSTVSLDYFTHELSGRLQTFLKSHLIPSIAQKIGICNNNAHRIY
jgi:hypothetical protein